MTFPTMERAGRVIAKWKKASDCVEPSLLARAAWTVAVGRRIAKHTTGVLLDGKTLTIQVEDEIWLHQLSTLRPQILRNLAKELGDGAVNRVLFRVKARRIGPGRAETVSRPAGRADEADQIADPVLRTLYRQSRRRSSA